MKKRMLLLLLAALLLILVIGYGHIQPPPSVQPSPSPAAQSPSPAPEPSPVPERVTVFEPSCTEAGYALHEDLFAGSTYIVDGPPALGHLFADGPACTRCGWQADPEIISELPRIDLSGSMDGISKDQRITLRFAYQSGNQQFSCYAFTTWQGHSSLAYPKKNYTVRLYADESITQKYRLHLGNWQLEHKYILKANYLDGSQVRNLIAARLWGDMAKTRPNLSARLRSTSNFGAVDGFPVTLWHNGVFQGLYTLNLHKDEDLYGMGGTARDAVVIANARTMDESLFRAPAAFAEDVSDWELEYCGTDEDNAWAKESFNDLIRFVISSDDETFRSGLSAHLDVESAIDYLLFLYVTGLEQNAAKDLVLIKYEGTPWMATVYDMEHAFGLSADGSSALDPSLFLPSMGEGACSSGTDSLLWDRLLQLYAPEIRQRWQTLRQNVLAQDTLIAQASALLNAIPPEASEKDRALYPERCLMENPDQQILAYIQQRLSLLDAAFAQDAL